MVDMMKPVFTIAIPTYQRPDLVMYAIESAINQRTSEFIEVLVVDNDPNSTLEDQIEKDDTIHKNVSLRYIRNSENIGMFGNWNKCISEARADWVTLLGDDDALHADYLKNVLPLCNDNYMAISVGKSEFMNDAAKGPLPNLREKRDGKCKFKKMNLRIFDFFNPTGTPAGFCFNRKAAIGLGGFEPEFYPSGDYRFAKKIAQTGGILTTNQKLAFVGIGDNVSMRVETLTGIFEIDKKIRALKPEALNTFIGLMNIAYQAGKFGFTVSEVTNVNKIWNVPLRILGFGFRVLKRAMLILTNKTVTSTRSLSASEDF